ncbi:MAG: AAA family ATPase [Acidobacteria bacterium]|nr:AAA family ATPase [Acidobacteriota bacterium]MCI0623556.1 AAA family ATPase [Acidobacteriota bacterium]MCI0719104.1 AAA family ATPase [Acidobacteriota bacterium]
MGVPFLFKSAFESFARDLTAAAIRDELEPVSCREKEIERVITTLLRQSKNNPVLIGDAGVGKTAVVEGLAQRVMTGAVPIALKPARILSLSHLDLIAGTTFRGQYERRLQALIHEASNDRNIILFIDELHNLIGAGSALGQPLDAANMLKPALAGGRLRVIGATTESEYNSYIQSDAALERRFQPIRIEELDRGETLQVLRARRPRLEIHHLVNIQDTALETAEALSIRYLPNRQQPDRSIDLLDETCALIQLRQNQELSDNLTTLKRKWEQLHTAERQTIEAMLKAAEAKGTPLERFSRGTFKVFEAVGLGVEKFLTGQTSARPPLPMPDSVRRFQESDPARLLTKLHCARLLLEDRLRETIRACGREIDAGHVRQTVTESRSDQP